jgi:lipid II:glycine glycyltransferase (peptidoglycan interpeptide bridge formation enzyme)
VPFTGAGGYYLYGASAEATTHDGIAKLLQLEVMKRLQAAGVRRYVLGGARLSDVAGTKWERIQQFKERFGSRLTEGLLWKMDLDRVRARVYDVALRVRHGGWRRLVLDAIDEERARGAGADV